MTERDDPRERELIAWIEHTCSCRVTAMERHARWRLGWYVEATADDGTDLSLYVRGLRNEIDGATFDREYRILRVLEAEGIPVPKLYGMCPEPHAIVMDRAPGRPDLSTAESDEERESVLRQYMDVLARIHQIDPAKFADTGLPWPSGPREIVAGHIDRWAAKFREQKLGPEPLVEFIIGWLGRNAPVDRTKVSFVVCDVAQFLFEDGQLTAVLDFETAYLGDALQDLAGMQERDVFEPLGDIGSALRYYEQITGEEIDADAFEFHAAAFASVTPLGLYASVHRPQPSGSALQYLEWWVYGCRWPLEFMAAHSKIPLPEGDPELVAEARTPYDAHIEIVADAVRALPADGELVTYERDTAADLAAYVARIHRYGPPVYRQDKAEVEEFLGAQFDSLEVADAALEAFVLAAGPEADAQLLPLLYQRVQRHCALFRPFIGRPTGANHMQSFAQLTAR